MGTLQWVVLALNAAAAAILLTAGIGKILAPQHVQAALAEVLPAPRGLFTTGRLRGAAVVEIAVAVSLLTTTTRIAGALGTAGLGLIFALLGAVGLRRGGGTPCGCFGVPGRHPLGWPNVGFGLALAAVGALNLLVSLTGPAGEYAAGAVLLMAACSLCLWWHRHRALQSDADPTPAVEPYDDVETGQRPAVWPDSLPDRHECVLLVLSTRCGTCADISRQLAGSRVEWRELGLVIATTTPEDAADFVATHGLSRFRHHVDTGGEWLVTQLTVRRSPSALVFAHGRLVAAYRFSDIEALRSRISLDTRSRPPAEDGFVGG